MLVNVTKADGSTQQQIGSPFKFSRTQPTYKHIGSPPGQHTEEILTEIGYTKKEIQTMQKAKLFG